MLRLMIQVHMQQTARGKPKNIAGSMVQTECEKVNRETEEQNRGFDRELNLQGHSMPF